MEPICVKPLQRGLMAGHPATGTYAGYTRHLRAGEPACPPCLAATSARGAAWNRANRHKTRKSNKRWAKAHPEYQPKPKDPAKRRAYYEANRERDRQKYDQWRRANLARMAWHERMRRARKAAVFMLPFTLAQVESKLTYWGHRCWMCGVPAFTVDHVKPIHQGGPHILANLRPACKACNSAKRHRWPYAVVLEFIQQRRQASGKAAA